MCSTGWLKKTRVTFPKRPHQVPRVAGDPDLIKEAVALLKAAERPLVISGTGIIWSGAMQELQEFVETTGIPFYTTPQGRGVIPEDHALSFLGARNRAWKEADVVLIVGTAPQLHSGFWTGAAFCGRCQNDPGRYRGRRDRSANRAVDVGIVGDAKMVLRQLTDEASDSFRGRDELGLARYAARP